MLRAREVDGVVVCHRATKRAVPDHRPQAYTERHKDDQERPPPENGGFALAHPPSRSNPSSSFSNYGFQSASAMPLVGPRRAPWRRPAPTLAHFRKHQTSSSSSATKRPPAPTVRPIDGALEAFARGATDDVRAGAFRAGTDSEDASNPHIRVIRGYWDERVTRRPPAGAARSQ